jgi:hypothetical protein
MGVHVVMSKAGSKGVSDAMKFEAMPVKSQVSARVVRSEIFRNMDNLNLFWLTWYSIRRYRFQISVIINIAIVGRPVFLFVHQFFA